MSKVTGVDYLIRRLRKKTKDIENVTTKGLIRAVIPIRRSMDETPPLIPIDTGNLRASWFVSASGMGSTEDAYVGGEGSFKGEDVARLSHDYSSVKQSYDASLTGSKMPTVIFGFTAYYAAEVHERVGASFRKSGAGAKFLQAAIRRNQKEILRIIADESRKAIKR